MHWSGKHQRIVQGINLQTLLWTDGSQLVPCDFRIYQGNEGPSKNDTFRIMLQEAKRREMEPDFVLFDSWYSSLDNLKAIRQLGWRWLTQLKSNRQVNPDNQGNIPIDQVEIGPAGKKVHLRGYGWIKVFALDQYGEKRYWATDDLEMTPANRSRLQEKSWKIEVFHRVLKQSCHVEHSQVRRARAVHAHIAFSIRAFLRLEFQRIARAISWYEIIKRFWRPILRKMLITTPFPLPYRTA